MLQSLHLVWYEDRMDQVSGQCSQDAVTKLKEEGVKFEGYKASKQYKARLRGARVGASDSDAIIKLAFFIHDLHEHISSLHRKNWTGNGNLKPFELHRGQSLHRQQFDLVQNSIDGLLSFNCFLSTSYDKDVALMFANASEVNSDTIKVVFKMTIDPTIESTLYVETQNICAYEAEEEILFFMHSICRINYCQPMKRSDDVWEISLILTSDNDPELQAITGAIRDQVNVVPGWHRVASLFLILGKFKEVHEICDNLLQLQQANDIGEITNLL
ncbi:unnamed protein product [Rotaria socialis]|uniref:Uncharacterized protein n=1 Tax=Rotaria socialis TaxID=392032 RepID=A0A819ZQC9_9BILA|nr:unnamed protein product [Rotaria socialis]CAF4171919.1 unnamed protein product [Rotaria socialis]CAF4457868.1 unnamed protein product [Rotaria socialis]